MLKAGSIIYALAVALLVAMTSGSLIMANQLSRLETQQYERTARLTDNVAAGLVFLQQQTDQTVNATIDLYNNGTDSVRLQKRAWGMFDVGMSEAKHRNQQYSKSALFGRVNDNETTTALYVADHGKPIKVCGFTELKGKCFLPESGVERSYIEGQNYVGDRLVYGPVEVSEKTLPKPNVQRLKMVQHYLSGSTNETDSVVLWESLETDSIFQSFANKTLVIVATAPIRLDHGMYRGNILFYSAAKIEVKIGVDLDQVLLFAPEIAIAEQTTMRVQAFASKQIKVGQGAKLTYPSVIGTFDEKRVDLAASIQLEEGAHVSGLVFAIPQTANQRFPAVVLLGKQCLVEGTVYVQGNTELQGTVIGSVYTDRFTLKTPSSQYTNQLLNATINGEELSPHFAHAYLFEEASDNAIVQWLH